MKFRLEFRLATEHMKDGEPIAEMISATLYEIREDIWYRGRAEGTIKDVNENNIGHYEIIREDDE